MKVLVVGHRLDLALENVIGLLERVVVRNRGATRASYSTMNIVCSAASRRSSTSIFHADAAVGQQRRVHAGRDRRIVQGARLP